MIRKDPRGLEMYVDIKTPLLHLSLSPSTIAI